MNRDEGCLTLDGRKKIYFYKAYIDLMKNVTVNYKFIFNLMIFKLTLLLSCRI